LEHDFFNYNKAMASAQVGEIIYTDKLTKELRYNELPYDAELRKAITDVAEYMKIPHNAFERHITKDFMSFIKDPNAFAERVSRFFPEEYTEQYLKLLDKTRDAYVRSVGERFEIASALE